MKNIGTILNELAVVNRKQNIRELSSEKELYAHWRNDKLFAIEHARRCKELGLPELQKRWEQQVIKYDHWARESKVRIRELGSEIYQ